ncbi:hypothetical protein NT01EI_2724 [Edwardsiella ictaluri 93-146]|uniref:Uncharacterized protein n=1 Tax=Edwardsiella ictaluri (strain 93-146) TaxID=634503 RepID=C5B8N1_EDWI9|nr:hypothetical protein NT01EI_2724 [Edwardsiella ictaluri 93-146]
MLPPPAAAAAWKNWHHMPHGRALNSGEKLYIMAYWLATQTPR